MPHTAAKITSGEHGFIFAVFKNIGYSQRYTHRTSPYFAVVVLGTKRTANQHRTAVFDCCIWAWALTMGIASHNLNPLTAL